MAPVGIKVRRATAQALSTAQHFGVVPLCLRGEGERLERGRGEYQH